MSATASGTSSLLTLGSIRDVCDFIDALPRDAAGELAVVGGGSPLDGAVFIEGNRVCWAAARGLARRLSDLLAASAKIERSRMEEHYLQCSRQRVPLGEHLVRSGLLSANELRAALLQHTTESLRVLFGTPRRTAWSVRKGRGFSARFTFATPEVLARGEADEHWELARAAHAELADALVEGEWGAAFVLADARAFPLPIALGGRTPDRIEPVLRLGRWACSAFDVLRVARSPRALVASSSAEETLVAWVHRGAVVAARTGPLGTARLLNRRARTRDRE